MRFLERISVPVFVTAGHILAFYAVFSLARENPNPRALLTIELSAMPEILPETPPQDETVAEDEKIAGTQSESEFVEDEVEGGNVEDSRAFDLIELPAADLELPEYTLQEIADSAAGTDGDTRGDGIEFGESLAPDGKNISLQESAESFPVEKTVPVNSENPATQLAVQSTSGAEKKGKQGNRESTNEGSFGSGGNGGKDAFATATFNNRVAPKYPRTDEIAGRTGTVVLLLEISSSGELKSVRVKKSSGSRSLDSAAIRAARASSYVPAREGGVAIDSHAEASYTFKK